MTAAMETLASGEGAVTELSDEERARWAAALPDIAGQWAEDADGRNLPGTEVLDAYMDLLREAGAPVPRDWSQR